MKGAILGLLVLAGCTSANPPNAQDGLRVTHVVDGDTLDIERGRRRVRVRLLRVDTPERDEPGYEEATRQLARKVLGKRVVLEFENERKDPYNRELAYVYLDGQNINVEMVRSGWSPFFDRYGVGKYADDFRAAEREAKRAKRGLWAED